MKDSPLSWALAHEEMAPFRPLMEALAPGPLPSSFSFPSRCLTHLTPASGPCVETTYVLGNYKTEPCKKPPRLCRQGYACPYYHNSKDRRRSPRKHKYRSFGPGRPAVGGGAAGMGFQLGCLHCALREAGRPGQPWGLQDGPGTRGWGRETVRMAERGDLPGPFPGMK